LDTTHREFSKEAKQRQHLTLVALGKKPADAIIQHVTILNVFTLEWVEDCDIVISGDRIAWTGPNGGWGGDAKETFDRKGLYAVPGFGEPHKHIESTHLSPEFEAELVIPQGNTWTVEASHEFSNVNGSKNIEFWLMPRNHGSPLKIFPVPGSATPPTAFESTGGFNDYAQIAADLRSDIRVPGLDEVMDWSAVWDPKNPGHERIWQTMEATWDGRGVVAGHGSGLREINDINAFAAAGLASDHECATAEEAWNKVSRGIFLMLRPNREAIASVIPYFIARGIRDWSNLSLTTDDRDAADTSRMGGSNYNIHCAIEAGAPIEEAYAMATYYPARHWHLEHIVGSIAPGRYADIVLLTDPKTVAIEEVFADGRLAARGGTYLLEVPKIDWPDWATNTIHIGREMMAADFAIPAPTGRQEGKATAAVLKQFHWEKDFMTRTLPVVNGYVERGTETTKLAIVDRYHATGALSKMFWVEVGPKTQNSALACSVSHDHHNIWVLGSSDDAMALAVNTLASIDGGWVLVNEGKVTATVRFEIGGLMTARSSRELIPELDNLWSEGEKLSWHNEGGIPRRMIFATLTCTPWHWVLVAPSERVPNGFVNVTNGESHPIVW
jgi:adenine deaminase